LKVNCLPRSVGKAYAKSRQVFTTRTRYALKENSVEVYFKDGKLYIALETSGNKELPLKPYGINPFTFGDFNTYEIRFIPNGKGSYDSANVYERRAELLKKTRL
jgi:hypothetical protein